MFQFGQKRDLENPSIDISLQNDMLVRSELNEYI